MELAAFSDRGIGTRERLEDYAADRIVTTAGGLQLQIAMVCDGAGGGEAGEMAARLTSRTIFESLEISTETSVAKLLVKAVEQANKAVYSELRGTGTSTVALAAVHLNSDSQYGRLFIASVGNSRIYLMRGGRIARLNIDHTLQNEYVFAGQMSPEEAQQLDDPEYVTRAIGIGAQVSVDIGFYAERGKNFVNSKRASRIGQKGMELQEGDTVFAASDGLFPFVHDDEFLNHALDDNVERATRTLLKYAADRGPEDNTALSMLFVPSRNRKMVRVGERLSTRQRAGIAVFLLAIILLIGFLGLQVASGEAQRVVFIATQTYIRQIILEASYTHTPTPLPPTATPTLAPIVGQIGDRASLTLAGLPVFAGRYIDPLNPAEINYVSVAGRDALLNGLAVNRAYFYLQPSTTIRLNQIVENPGQQGIDLVLGRGGDLFVNAGDYQNGGISVALEQNPDISFKSQSACFSAKQILADSSKLNDTDKVALVCYGGGACSYNLPGAEPVSVASGETVLLDIDNQKVIDTAPLSQADVNSYRETIWSLTKNESQLNCLGSWLDEDQDSVQYPVDECPTDPGSVPANGCPDQDNDGFADTADACPTNPSGIGSTDGCPLPDVDGDGLRGDADFCPFDVGPEANDGCPLEGPLATQHMDLLTATYVGGFTSTPSPSPTITLTPTATTVPVPDAVADSYSTLGEKLLIVAEPGVLANDKLNDATLEASSGKTTKGGTYSLSSTGSFTYNPPADYFGLDTFTYTLTNTVGSDATTVTINVLQPPIQLPVAAFTLAPISGPAPLTVAFDASSSTGSINTYTWDFGDGSTGSGKIISHEYTTDGTFTVILTVDGPGGTDTASNNVTVSASPPVATGDGYSTAFNTSLNVGAPGVLGNDVDAGGNPLTAALTGGSTTTQGGTIILNASGGFSYTPANGFVGTDTFTYRANNGTANSNVATVTITVSAPVNTAPVANGDGYSTSLNTPLPIPATGVLLNDTDADADPLTASLVSGPSSGTLTLNGDGSFNFTPVTGFTGTVTFTYRANDGTAFSNIATVTISVNAGTNNAPTANPDPNNQTNEDTALNVAAPGVLANDIDQDGNQLTAVLATNPTNGSVTLNPDGSFTYTPNANFNGTDSFTYQADDGPLNSAAVTVTITVVAVNDLPVAVNNGFTVAEDGSFTTTALQRIVLNDTDVDNTPTTLTAVLVTPPTNGTLTLNPTGLFTYTPNPDFNGTDTFTYRANDGTANSANIATVTMTVTAVNDEPVTVGDGYFTPVNTLITIAAPGILANDIDVEGNPLTAVTIVDLTLGNGVLAVNANGSFTFTPNMGFVGTVAFTYQASDGLPLTSNVGQVTIAVGNNAPNGVGDVYSTPVDVPLVIAAPGVLANDTDVENDPRTVSLNPLAFIPPTNGTMTVPLAANGSFTYTPNPGFIGTDSFSYRAADATGFSDFTTVTITVGSNTAPVAVDDPSYTMLVTDFLFATSVLANDTDVNGNALTATLVTPATLGVLQFYSDGTFFYFPNLPLAGLPRTDTFTYQANDGSANSNIATVTITINPAPVAVDDNYNTPFDTQLDIAAPGLLVNDTVIGALTPQVQPFDGPFSGTLTLNADGSFSYMPIAGFFGQDIFFYQLYDAGNNPVSNYAVVTINVGLTNNPPVINNDSYGTPVDTPLNIPALSGVLANDTDPDGDPLTAFLAIFPSNSAAFTFNPDGSFDYTPTLGFTGIDTFFYQIGDGIAFSNLATVTINVGGAANLPPIANGNTYTTTTGVTLNIGAPGVLGNDTDPEGVTLTAAVVVTTTNGALTLNPDGSFTYIPNVGFKGTDSFTYRANDGLLNSNVVTVTIGVSTIPKPIAIEVPDPPPATACTDTNFENPGMIRSHFTNDIDRDQLFCRLIAAGGTYMYWFGSPITNAGNVGAQNVLDLGLVSAVDVFSTRGVTGFVGDVDICLKGSGYMIYMNVSGQPRVPQLWSSWTTDAFPGYTCTTMYAPGTVILVSNKPN